MIWYNIIESIPSTNCSEGPQMKFIENNSWEQNNNERNIGAAAVDGRGIKKISLLKSLNRSARIWKAPFLPIRVGPIRRCAKANNFRSISTTNRVSRTTNKDEISINSFKI